MIIILLFFILPFCSTSHVVEQPVLVCYSQSDPSSSSPWEGFNSPFLKNSAHSVIPQGNSQGQPYGLGTSFHGTLETKETIIHHQMKECQSKNGVYLQEQCLKFIVPEMNHTEAKEFCSDIGGKLWVPDLSDPFLFQNLAKDFPIIFGAKNNSVWLGITLLDERFITLDGDDLTNTYLGLMGDKTGANGECVVLSLITGLLLESQDCSEESDFVCEITLKSKNQTFYKKTLNKYKWVE